MPAMKKSHERLRVIDGGPEPKKPRRKRDGEILRCRCGSNAFREVILGPMTDGSRTWGGTKQLKCDHCGTPYSAR